MKKITDIVLRSIDLAGYVLLTAFAVMFALAALTALVFTFVEGDMFNLIGAGTGAFLAWMTWSVRRGVL